MNPTLVSWRSKGKSGRTAPLLAALGMLAMSLPSGVHGQGGIRFANGPTGAVIAPVYDPTGSNRLSGGFVATLYIGTSPGNLIAGSPNQPFLAGYWAATNLTVAFPPSTFIYVQVRIWNASSYTSFEQADAAGGSVGISPVMGLVVPPPTSPPAPLTGLPSIALVLGVEPVWSVSPITLSHGFQFFGVFTAYNYGLPTSCVSSSQPNSWFRASVPNSGIAVFDTEGSAIDTIMGVFTGDILSPTLVACNDDISTNNTASRIEMPVAANTLYLVCVAGKGGSGKVVLNYYLQSAVGISTLPNPQIQVSWPADATNFLLEATGNLPPTNAWSTVTNSPVVVGNLNTVQFPLEQQGFYRLRANRP